MMTATYSPDDNKLRLYSTARLDVETYQEAKRHGFIWAAKQECFVAPMWTPEREDFLLSLCDEIEDDDSDLVSRAEARAERFEEYGEKRAQESERALAAVDAITQHIPLGQPILVGHHSEKRARKNAERIERGMQRAVRLWDTSQYWEQRAKAALRHAKYKELPGVRARRIKTLEADLRKIHKQNGEDAAYHSLWEQVDTHEKALTLAGYDSVSCAPPLSEYPREAPASQYEGMMSLYSALVGSVITWEQAKNIALEAHRPDKTRRARWIAHIERRLAYERAMLEEAVPLAAEASKGEVAFEVGGQVRVKAGGHWYTILRVNRKDGRIVSMRTTRQYGAIVIAGEVVEYTAPTADQTEAVKAAMKKPPLVNYPAEGSVNMTKAEWDKLWKDYKGTREHKREGYAPCRIRTAVIRSALCPVFITDAKVVEPAKLEAA